MKIIAAGAGNFKSLALTFIALFGNNNTALAGHELSGNGIFVGFDLLGSAFGNNFATMNTSPRTYINNMIGRGYGIFVMFNHNHCIAQITQAYQGFEQALVVALMQTDGGFIEDIHNSHQTGTNLAGQTYPLSFTARQSVGAAIERQII